MKNISYIVKILVSLFFYFYYYFKIALFDKEIKISKHIFINQNFSFGHQLIAYLALSNFEEKQSKNDIVVFEFFLSERNNLFLNKFFHNLTFKKILKSNHSFLINLASTVFLNVIKKKYGNKVISYEKLVEITKSKFLKKEDFFAILYDYKSKKYKKYGNFYWVDKLLQKLQLKKLKKKKRI